MKLIEPSVELWSEEGVTPEQHIARCARICYGHDGEGKDPKKLVDGLMNSGHMSMLRHSTFYSNDILYKSGTWYMDSPYCSNFITKDSVHYFSTNRQALCDVGAYGLAAGGSDKEINVEDILKECKKGPNLFKIVRLTFCITTQISTSRELNRVSPNNIAERSTRYCSSKDGLEICKPWWFPDSYEEIDYNLEYRARAAENAWLSAESYYRRMLEFGAKPEDARGVLPLDTATKVVYTYSAEEWKHIIDLRYYGTTGKPHPNAKLVIGMVRDKINNFAKEHGINYQL